MHTVESYQEWQRNAGNCPTPFRYTEEEVFERAEKRLPFAMDLMYAFPLQEREILLAPDVGGREFARGVREKQEQRLGLIISDLFVKPEEVLDINEQALASVEYWDRGRLWAFLYYTSKNRIVSVKQEKAGFHKNWLVNHFFPISSISQITVNKGFLTSDINIRWSSPNSGDITYTYEGVNKGKAETFVQLVKSEMLKFAEWKNNRDELSAIINARSAITFDELVKINIDPIDDASIIEGLQYMVASGLIDGTIDIPSRRFVKRGFETKETVSYVFNASIDVSGGAVVLRCKGCGAPLQVDKNIAKCEHCKTEQVVPAKILGML